MKRRSFLKKSITAVALAGVGPAQFASAAETKTSGREYYELRAYRLQAASDHSLLDGYLEKAAIPALNRLGIKSVGVFTEVEPKESAAVYMLIPYSSLDTFATAAARLNDDSEYQSAGSEYLQTTKTHPGFVRIDSWLMLAFAGMPRLELPAYSRDRKPRIFEVRTYESYSEQKALKKVQMFNSGEIDAMHEVGLAPVFYGQTLVGSDLPHLTYMLSAENREAHKQHWSAFGRHPTWKKLQADPQYADTVSKITSRFLVPTAFSQI